jgi:hypothetical protein
MHPLPGVLLVASLAAAATAQSTTFTLPSTLPLPQNTNVPFSAGIGRYQQWHPATEIATALSEPMRFERLEFLAGQGQTTLATTIDAEVALAHGFASGLTGSFAFNFAAPPVTVFPRAPLALSAGAPGAVVLTVPFATRFTWDGVSPIVIDVRIWGNGRGNQAFAYDFRGTAQGGFVLTRCYQGGNANATSGVSQQGQGLYARFTARPGITLPYGTGCPGVNFITPVASVQQVPSPGIVWTHQVGSAASQRLCVLVLGDSRTQWGPDPLPLSLSSIGAGNCFLLASPIATFFTMTVGSPGAGIATMPLQLPPFTSYVGMSVYTQWLVSDPAASNGVLSASGGIWSIVAPVGG